MTEPHRSPSDLQTELIQVAAVARAFLEDVLWGITDAERGGVIDALINSERYRQEAKWGQQHHSPMEWIGILGEEYGEACRAVLEGHRWPTRQQEVFDKELGRDHG
ncbi:MAG: hypothetical protein ACE5E8_02360 [Acidimicrobiia bacterium]